MNTHTGLGHNEHEKMRKIFGLTTP